MIKTVWGITLYVSNLKRATKFYEEILGLEKKYEFSNYVGFECGGVEIGFITKPSNRKKASVLSPSIEFLVDDVKVSYENLKKKHVCFTRELHDASWGGKQATFTDQDGNVLEIMQMNWAKYFSVSTDGAKKKS